MTSRWIVGAASIATALAAVPALAEQQTLKFRLITHDVSSSILDAPNVADTAVGSYKAVGVAVFDDGRIAFKDFVRIDSGTSQTGDMTGYSTYTFENGDSLTAKFAGGWSAEGFGRDYEVLSGTGAYAGVTGTGRFDGTEDAWADADLMNGTFTLEVPGA